MFKRLTVFLFCILLSLPAYSKNISGDWHNDLRSIFLKNKAIIYTINIRSFNAKDFNGNELIDENEESGNFLNAINELDNLTKMGINTLHILPITPVGKIKAFGTAGSLYAITKFDDINPQLVSKKSSMSGIDQARKFVKECHKRNIRVIVDLPSCGSYDLFIEHPEYFVKDETGNAITPLDWTDVRLFDSGNDKNINEVLLSQHKKFIDMIMFIGADGVRADVARIKPEHFWEELIKYTREKDREFLFLAEDSKLWKEPVSEYTNNISTEDLFDAGFDGYLGSYMGFKNMDSKTFISTIKEDLKLFEKYDGQKSVVGSFSTHDEVSPILIHGTNFSKMIIWLNATLPLNSYFIDGFPTGDTYNYSWANKPAKKSQTDDAYYFTHKGQIDIFNFSRKPGGKDNSIYEEFVLANKFKNYYSQDLLNAKFVPLKSSNANVFAYARVTKNATIVVFGNMDYSNPQEVIIKIPKFTPKNKVLNIRVYKDFMNEYSKRKIKTTLDAGDTQVLIIRNLVF